MGEWECVLVRECVGVGVWVRVLGVGKWDEIKGKSNVTVVSHKCKQK